MKLSTLTALLLTLGTATALPTGKLLCNIIDATGRMWLVPCESKADKRFVTVGTDAIDIPVTDTAKRTADEGEASGQPAMSVSECETIISASGEAFLCPGEEA